MIEYVYKFYIEQGLVYIPLWLANQKFKNDYKHYLEQNGIPYIEAQVS